MLANNPAALPVLMCAWPRRPELVAALLALCSITQVLADPVPLALSINAEDHGVHLVELDEHQHIRIAREVLLDAGLAEDKLPAAAWLALQDFALSHTFDPESGSLTLQVPADWLPPNQRDLSGREPIPAPLDNRSVYLNYAFNATRRGEQDVDWQAPFELGLRYDAWLLNSTYNLDERQGQRGQTVLQRDDRAGMWRLALGDVGAQAGPLGGTQALAGLRVSSAFNLQPGFVASPSLQLNYMLDTPAEVEIWLDGRRVATESVPAGPLQLNNLPLYGGRSGNVRLLIRDAFGEVREIETDVYISSRQLGRGVHQFSYSIGLPRLATDRYANQPTALFEHRIGLNDHITAGLSGSVDDTQWQSGLELAGARPWLGEWSLAYSHGGAHAANSGHAMQFSLNRSMDHVLFSASAFQRDAHYQTVGLSAGRLRRANVRMGLSSGWLRGLNLSHSWADGELTNAVGDTPSARSRQWRLNFSRNLGRGLAVNAQAWHDTIRHQSQISLSFNWLFGRELASSRLDWRDDDQRSWVNRISRSGDGQLRDGWTVELEQRQADGQAEPLRSARADYDLNARYATARLGYRRDQLDRNGEDHWSLRLSGATAWADGKLALGRPIRGGFAIVDAGKTNVDVFHNNQLAGNSGAMPLLLPNLTPYYPQSINFKLPDSLPLGTRVSSTQHKLSVWDGGGSTVSLALQQLNSYEGRIDLLSPDGQRQPAQFGALVLHQNNGDSQRIALGLNGFLYLDQIPPGEYRAEVLLKDESCHMILHLPQSNQSFNDLGVISCSLTAS